MLEKTISRPFVENSIARLRVTRLASFGAFLDAGTGNSSDDILLHKAQQTKDVAVGDIVEVFLYHDPRHRLTASMRLPKIPDGGLAYTKVLLTVRFGAFVEAGTERGIFLPHHETIGDIRVGQNIWVKRYTDKTGRLAVTMHVADDIRRLAVPARDVKPGDTICGTVYNITPDGAFLVTREKYLAFLYRNEVQKTLAMGDELTGRVVSVRDDGAVSISLRPAKENALMSDGETILAYLANHGGVMAYDDKSLPETIEQVFHMSKAAYKRALGHLLKEGKIEKKPGGGYFLIE